MLRKLTLPTLSALCLALPLTWVACSSSSGGGAANVDAGNNTTGDGDSNGDGDGPTGDGDGNGNDDAGNGANGDGDSNGDGDPGNGGSGGAGGSSNGSGGMGPGLVEGEVNCLGQERPDLATAFYFGYHQICSSTNGKDGMLTEMQVTSAETVCSGIWSGTVVDSCSDENVVAYCAGDEYSAGIIVATTRRIYGGPVTPDAVTVARNALPICGGLPVYDLDDNLLTATCSGTVTAMVDDELMDFSEKLTCTFRTDGTQTTYFVRAAKDPTTLDNKELTLKIIKNGDDISYFTELNTLPVGYLEGATAAGAFAFQNDNTDLMLDITNYSDEGEGFAGTFSIGELATGNGTARAITDGNIDIQFTVE